MTASPRALPSASSPCPCGRPQTFAACCGSILAGERPAATAEDLMRSRFTAHAVGDYKYLHRTYLETARRPYVEESDHGDLTWTRLLIHHHENGPRPDRATVDFSAYFDDQGQEGVLQEKSEFHRIDGVWYYARTLRTGPEPVKSTHPKVGRNDPCPCGSGRKYKQCCLKVA